MQNRGLEPRMDADGGRPDNETTDYRNHGMAASRPMILPLPEGEGRGEGERVQPAGNQRCHVN